MVGVAFLAFGRVVRIVPIVKVEIMEKSGGGESFFVGAEVKLFI